MALTPEQEPTSVVGFSGLAVEGGAGLRSPVFERADGRYFVGNPDGPIRAESTCSHAELLEFEARGVICLTTPQRRVAGSVFLYAHPKFVSPGGSLFNLSERLDGLNHDEKLRFHVGYFPRQEALQKLGDWGKRLLSDAQDHLRRGRPRRDWERALDSAERARIAAPPPEHPKLRIEAFVILGAAWIALKKDFEDILWDAATDRNPDLLRAVEERSRARAQNIIAPPLETKRVKAVRERTAHGDRSVLDVGAPRQGQAA